MKKYKVKDEFNDCWGFDIPENGEIIVDDAEIERLAKEWGCTAEELMEQVEEVREKEMRVKLKGINFDIIIEGATKKELEKKAEFVKELMGEAFYGAVVELVEAKLNEKKEIKELEKRVNAYDKEAEKIRESIWEAMATIEELPF